MVLILNLVVSAKLTGELKGRESSVDEGLLHLLKPSDDELSVDWSTLAEYWLDLIRPTWYDHLRHCRRTGPLRLKDIRQALIEKPLPTAQLQEILESQPLTRPLDERIVAAILGIPSTEAPVQ